MKFFILSALVTLALCAPSAFAEDSPPPAPVGQIALTQPAPAAPQTPAPAPVAANPVVARKEETEVKIRSGFFAGLFPDKNAITKVQAADEITKLRADNESLRTQLTEAQNELKAIAEDWPAIEAALAQGTATAPVLQTPLGQKVADLSMKTAAQQMAATGHDPKKLPGPGASKPDTGKSRLGTSAEADALREEFRAATNPVEKAALWTQIKAADDAAKNRNN